MDVFDFERPQSLLKIIGFTQDPGSPTRLLQESGTGGRRTSSLLGSSPVYQGDEGRFSVDNISHKVKEVEDLRGTVLSCSDLFPPTQCESLDERLTPSLTAGSVE